MVEAVILCIVTGLATLALHETGLLAIGGVAARFGEESGRAALLGIAVAILFLHVTEIALKPRRDARGQYRRGCGPGGNDRCSGSTRR